MMELAEVGPEGIKGVIFGLFQRESAELRVKLGLDLHGALQLQGADRIIHRHAADPPRMGWRKVFFLWEGEGDYPVPAYLVPFWWGEGDIVATVYSRYNQEIR